MVDKAARQEQYTNLEFTVVERVGVSRGQLDAVPSGKGVDTVKERMLQGLREMECWDEDKQGK